MLRRTTLLIAALLLGWASLAGAEVALTEGLSGDPWQSLVDDRGFEWDLDVWSGRSYSAWAGAIDHVAGTGAVTYTTVSGGTEVGDPGPAFDGYGYLHWRTSPVGQWRAHWVYEPPTLEPGGQQYAFATESYARVQVGRKLFVPDDDSFARWLTTVRNGRANPQYVELRIFGWLGYGAGAAVVTSSDGDALAEVTDEWVTTRDILGGSELKTGHVLQGAGASVAPSTVEILDGTGFAVWTYALTLDPGETASILSFAVAAPTAEETAARAREIAGLCGSSLALMTDLEKAQVANFDTALAADSCGDAEVAGSRKGDFDGDGRADILWRHGVSGDLFTWLMDGTTARATATFNPSGLSDPAWKVAGIADFDRDGHQDLLWHHQARGDLYVWFMAPDEADPAFDGGAGTTVRSGGYLSPASFTDTRWQIRATDDFNRDGTADILWHRQTTGELYVWFLGPATAPDGGAGDDAPGPATTVTGAAFLTPSAMPDTRWQIRGSADFDGDDAPDLLWHHQTTGELYVWFLGADLTVSGGTFLSPSAMPDTRWQVQQVADFDGDERADILWRHMATGDLYVWLLGPPEADARALGEAPPACTVVGGGSLSPSALTDMNWSVVPR
jgi:hypothetical protein